MSWDIQSIKMYTEWRKPIEKTTNKENMMISSQKGQINGNKHFLTTMMRTNASQNTQDAKLWGVCTTAAEYHIGFHCCLPRTGSWCYSGQELPKLDSWTFPGPRFPDVSNKIYFEDQSCLLWLRYLQFYFLILEIRSLPQRPSALF